MTTPVQIRTMVQSDMAEVVVLLQSISEYQPAESDYPAIWQSFCEQTNRVALVAERNSRVIGYGSMVIDTKIRGGKMAHMEELAVHPDQRRTGIGQQIANRLCDRARELGCYKVALQSKEYNIPFYERLGFQVSGLTVQRFI